MASPSSASNLATFFALNRNTSIMLAALVSMGFAEELWMRFLPKYLESLGAAVWAIGLFDAIKTWIGAVYAYPGGLITDRWGLRKALSFFTLSSVAGYVWLLASPHWTGVILSSFLFLSWTSFSLPATFSLVGSSLAANQHAMGIGVQATLKRIPIILGPVAGGLLIDRFGIINGIRFGVITAIALGCLTVTIQWQIQEMPGTRFPAGRVSFWRSAQSFSPALRRLLLSDVLVRFCERIPYAWVILYAMDDLGTDGHAVWHFHGNRNGLSHSLPHSCCLSFGPLRPRTIHCRDLRVLYALSCFVAGRPQLQRTLYRFCHPRAKGIRRDGEEIADHSTLPRAQTRPNHRDLLLDSRLPRYCRRFPGCSVMEHQPKNELRRRRYHRRCRHAALCVDSPGKR